VSWPTCPPKLKMTTLTSSAIPSSFLTWYIKSIKLVTTNAGYVCRVTLPSRIVQTSNLDLCNLLTTRGTSMTSRKAGTADERISRSLFIRSAKQDLRPLEISSLGRGGNILGQYPGSRSKNSQCE
jgi:hypothetical protein